MSVEYVVTPIRDLDGSYIDYASWMRELDDETRETGVVCQAFDADFEVGVLAIDGVGKVLIVEVESEHRRKGIATGMLAELEAAGYTVVHDWENLRDDGAAWVGSLGERQNG